MKNNYKVKKAISSFGNDGFEYAGAIWCIDRCYGDLRAEKDGEVVTNGIFLYNGKVTKKTFSNANRYVGAPKAWTPNTIRSAVRIAKRLGWLK